jgi:hypothetical protein
MSVTEAALYLHEQIYILMYINDFCKCVLMYIHIYICIYKYVYIYIYIYTYIYIGLNEAALYPHE